MWQRVQTLYLAIATILTASLFFCNVATIIGPEGEILTIRYYERLAYLLFMISLLSAEVISLLSFKTRMLQMRVAVLAGLLMTGFQIWLGVDFFVHRKEMVFSITAIFPLVCAILDFMAARAIALDEAMVQSASRIRKSKRRK